jgi:hypothetical protein
MTMYLQKVIISKKFLQKIEYVLKVMTKIAGSESGSGSVSQRHESADPDSYQNLHHRSVLYIQYAQRRII